MKSFEELMAIKNKMQDKVALRQTAGNNTRIVVGMATTTMRVLFPAV